MPTKTVPETITNAKLIDIIRTGVPGPGDLGKMRALSALRLSRSTKKVEVFSEILADRQELPRFKHMAALGLYELGGQRAEQALIENARAVDERTAATVAEMLGRVGSADSLRVVRELEAVASPDSRSRAAFGASLLAYRHNLPGHEVEVPGRAMKLDVAGQASEIKVSRAEALEAERALAALRQEPVGVNLDLETAQQIQCQPNTFLFLWNRQFAGNRLRGLLSRKGVMGLVFRRSHFEDAYALSAFVLGTPKGGEVQLSLHRSNGGVLYAGTMRVAAQEAQFALGTAERPGAVAIEFSGAIRDGQLAMDAARSAGRSPNQRQPKRVAEAIG